MATEMLESYVLSCKKKGDIKNYDLKFKVAKGVKVTFTQVGDINEVHLNYDTSSLKNDFQKKYSVKGNLKLQFYQNSYAGAGKDALLPVDPDPDIDIKP